MLHDQTHIESPTEFLDPSKGSPVWAEAAAGAYDHGLRMKMHVRADDVQDILVARAEYHEDGTPIVVDPGPPMDEETGAADALEPVIRALSAGRPLNTEELARQTRNAIDGKTNPDSVENAIAWLEDFLEDRLHDERGRANFVASPWDVKFRYKNDEITVKITHDYDKNLGTTVVFPRDPASGPVKVLDK